jgi:integrase
MGRRIILKEQIAETYDSVGAENRLRNRALIMVAKDTGVRISDISLLNVGHYRSAATMHNEEGKSFKIFGTIQTAKMKVNAHVHLGPEAVLAIDAYLAERGRPEDDSPFFIDRDERSCSTIQKTMQTS